MYDEYIHDIDDDEEERKPRKRRRKKSHWFSYLIPNCIEIVLLGFIVYYTACWINNVVPFKTFTEWNVTKYYSSEDNIVREEINEYKTSFVKYSSKDYDKAYDTLVIRKFDNIYEPIIYIYYMEKNLPDDTDFEVHGNKITYGNFDDKWDTDCDMIFGNIIVTIDGSYIYSFDKTMEEMQDLVTDLFGIPTNNEVVE
ncbi:MAG: hypothetical protein MJ244_00990 [Clostridia bacterium]|nr:hypothetical protein [Clostridia bacterium]